MYRRAIKLSPLVASGFGLFSSYVKEERTPLELRSKGIHDAKLAASTLGTSVAIPAATLLACAPLGPAAIGMLPIAISSLVAGGTLGLYGFYKAGEASGEILQSHRPSY